MCVAIPAKVVALEAEGMATVSFRGVRRSISVAFVEDVVLDDYLLVHADHALRKVSENRSGAHTGTDDRSRIADGRDAGDQQETGMKSDFIARRCTRLR